MDPYTTFQLNHRSQTQKKLKMDWDPDLSGVHSKKTLENELVGISESLSIL